MGVLTPELQFLKSQLLQVAEQIRAFADRNFENGVVDKLTPDQQRKLDQAAYVAVKAFVEGGFCDPKIGECFGSFATINIEEFFAPGWQAPEGFRTLFDTLTQTFWYRKQIDVAPVYDKDGLALTKQGTIQRWHQETIDRANLLEYLSAEVGSNSVHSIESYKTRLFRYSLLNDFRSIEEILSTMGAIGCQDRRVLKYFRPDSKFLKACYPFDENVVEAQAILDEIKLLICVDKVELGNQTASDIQPTVQEILTAIDWFLDLSPFDHTQMVNSKTGYQRIFQVTWNSSRLNDQRNALVESPNKIEMVCLWCLANGQSSLGSEIKSMASKAFDCLKTFRTELSEQIEQWLWNNVRGSITKSDDLYSVYGEELFQSHEELIAEFTRLQWCFNSLNIQVQKTGKTLPDTKMTGVDGGSTQQETQLDLLVGNLLEYDKQFLMAMLKLKALTPETKTSIPKIVYAINKNADPNSGYKHCSPRLQSTQPPLIVKAGTRGFYLSPSGITIANRLGAHYLATFAPPTN